MGKDCLQATKTRLQAATHTAVATLEDLARNAKNPETRRKAALDILTLSGFTPGTQALYALGIGPTDPAKVDDKRKQEKVWDNLIKELTAG